MSRGLLAKPALALLGGGAALLLCTVAGLSGLPGTALASPLAVAQIPAPTLRLYQQAAAGCPGLSWTVLAAIGEIASDHGRRRGPGLQHDTTAAGARGPMLLPPAALPAGHEGVAYSLDEAVPLAAQFLCGQFAQSTQREGTAEDGWGAPLRHYACDPVRPACQVAADEFADAVLELAARYGLPAGQPSDAARVAVAAATGMLGTPYLWGGSTPGGFDCSGLTQWAYAQAGVVLPRAAQQQYDTGPVLDPGTALLPGDLVFFGTGPTTVEHAGIYIGDGLMVDAPHTGATVRVDRTQNFTPDLLGATRPGR